jgi:hypothetical protein
MVFLAVAVAFLGIPHLILYMEKCHIKDKWSNLWGN